MKKLLLYSLILLLSYPVFSQADSIRYDKTPVVVRKFTPKQLDKYKKDKDFNYLVEKTEPTLLDRIIDWIKHQLYRFFSWLFGEQRAGSILAFIIGALPYIVGIILLFLILKVFLNVRTETLISGSAKKTKINIIEEEDIIKNKNIKELIDKALYNKNYRLAIRYWYLYTLQILEQKEIIQWEQQKTNHDYEREIANKTLQANFIEITYLYDFVWYGNFDIDKNLYQKATQMFTALETRLK